MNEAMVLKANISRTKQFILPVSYIILTSLPAFLVANLVCSLLGAWLIASCLPFGAAFGIALFFILGGNLALIVGKAWAEYRKKRDFIPEEYVQTIDFEKETFQEASKAMVVEMSFRRVKRCRRFFGNVVLECSQMELYFLPYSAFPSTETVERLVSSVRRSIRASGNNRIQVIPPSVVPPAKRGVSWKTVGAVGCGVLLVFGLTAGFAAYHAYRAFLGTPAEFVDIRLSTDELSELSTAFLRLDKALKENAPALAAKRKTPDPETLLCLQEAMQGKTVDALSLWHRFFAGLEDCELIPGGKVAGVDLAVSTRLLNDTPMTRLTAPGRGQSMILLYDGAGDGYFFGVTREYDYVYWDMLEDTGQVYIGSMASFVGRIADSIEKRRWTYNADGTIQASEGADFEFLTNAAQGDPMLPR